MLASFPRDSKNISKQYRIKLRRSRDMNWKLCLLRDYIEVVPFDC